MFDFSNLVVRSTVDSKLSVSQIQQNIKDIAVTGLFGDNVVNFVQIDTHKFAMPIDYNGKIRWVEVDFVAKKDDFNAELAEHNYQVKVQKALEKELEQESKKKSK